MSEDDSRSAWQRRYDERGESAWQRAYDDAMERERLAAEERGDVTGGEVAAIYGAGCAPGWFGLAGVLIAGAIVWFRRRQRGRTGGGA